MPDGVVEEGGRVHLHERSRAYCMLGQHPPAPHDAAPGQGEPEAQAKSLEPPFPIPMLPMRDMSFSL
jgi:hypothetical protein